MAAISHVTLVVRDYDEAIAFFTKSLRFRLIQDSRLSDNKRWVIVAPPGAQGARLLLARAANAEQADHIGNQTGGRVTFFLDTDDFWSDHQHMQASGVEFLEPPREEPYGTVAVFRDLCGNKWDLVERK